MTNDKTDDQSPAEAHGLAELVALELERIANDPPISGNELAQARVLMAAASLREFGLAGGAANVQPKGTAANAALVPMETLKTWKGMVNTLAALSLKSDRITTGIALKSFIQDQIDEAQAHTPAPEPASARERWNIERDGDALLVCFNDHEKGQGCRFERFVPESTQAPAPVAETRHPLTSELVAAALLLKRWAEERNEPPGWHIAGIGAVSAQAPAVPHGKEQP